MTTLFQRLGAVRFAAHQEAARERAARQRHERSGLDPMGPALLCSTFATLSSELLRDNVEEGDPFSPLGPCECTDQGATRRWYTGQVRIVIMRDDWGDGPMCVGCGRIHTENFHYEE